MPGKHLIYLAFVGLAACASGAGADEAGLGQTSPESIKVMVLGSYHMAGSTSDVINVETDNVLTERRQAELEHIAFALAEYQPTIVVTERITEAPEYIDPYFADFDEAMLHNSQNERVQIAFRLANHAGVTRVHGIDEQPSEGEPDYFPFGKLMEHAAKTGQKEALNSLIGGMQTTVSGFTASTANDHIATRLAKLNSGPMSSPVFYYKMAQYDIGEEQPAAELQAYWFMRNAKIWSKIMDVVQPGDRVVIVYGAGHKFWLEHFVEQTPGFEVVDPVPYLERAAQSSD